MEHANRRPQNGGDYGMAHPPPDRAYGPLRASRPDVFHHFPHFAADRRENRRFSPDFPPWWVTYPQVLHA